MYQLFTQKTPYTVLVLFIFTLIVKIKVLFHPLLPVVVPGRYFYNSIFYTFDFLFHKNAFAYSFVTLIILFTQALYVNAIIEKHRLLVKHSYSAAFIYILLSSIHPSLSTFSEPLFVNWVLLWSIDVMMGLHITKNPHKLVYNASLLISLSLLFSLSYGIFLFLLLICLIMFRPIRIDEWVVSLAGYLTPAYIVIMLLFLYNNLSLLSAWSKGGMYHLEITKDMRPLIATLAGCSLLVMGGVYMLLQSGQMINIQIRRSWTALFFYLFTAIGAAFLIPNAVIGGWLIALPPLSLVAAPALATDKYKKFANFTLIFSILFLAFTLYINK